MLVKISDDVRINLASVSNINVLKDKMVFNMCYSFTDRGNITNGYYYVDLENNKFMESSFFKNNFVKIVGEDRKVFINKNHVSLIKKDFTNNPKIIVSFNHSVMRHDFDNLVFGPGYIYVKVNRAEVDKKYKKLISDIEDLLERS